MFRSVKLLVVFCLTASRTSALTGQEEVKVTTGEDVTLQCPGPTDAAIEVLEWIRPDLVSDGYIFFYRGGVVVESYLHPDFVGRVELKDPEMTGGDVSVILKDVNIHDTGTYECRIMRRGQGRMKRHSELRHVINLKVEEGAGQTRDGLDMGGTSGGGHVGLAAGLSAAAVLVVFVVVIVVVKLVVTDR